MTAIGGAAEKDQPKKKKSGPGGCMGIAVGVVLLFVVLIIVSYAINANQPKANPHQYTPSASAEPVSVDSATSLKVRTACAAQLRAVAVSSKKHFTGVPDKPYDITSIEFTGDVEEVSLPYKEVGWEVPVTWTSNVADGSTLTNRQVCQFRNLQQDATMLNRTP